MSWCYLAHKKKRDFDQKKKEMEEYSRLWTLWWRDGDVDDMTRTGTDED